MDPGRQDPGGDVEGWVSQGSGQATPPPPAPPPIPDHRLLRLIGRGSYGEVWLARNVMNTPRAVKVVYRSVFEHDRPFDREFAGLQRYEPISRSHEGLVNILHVGRHEPGRCFYAVMELADPVDREPTPTAAGLADTGAAFPSDSYRPRTLRAELQRRGRLPLDECLQLGTSLASALGHLHKHGLVHRDLKPSNIIFVNGRPKIADIGLVAQSGDSHSFVGTEGFFPPQGPGTVQADLYALGKVLYEASTGLDRLRFPQMPVEWLTDPQREGLVEFNEIVLRACETDPAVRYQSAEEMLAGLALLRVGKSVRRMHGLERRLRQARRLGAAVLAVAVLATGALALERRQARVEREARQRVERAEAESRRQLAEARLAQAQALRRTGQAGQRFDSLEVIHAAATNGPSLALRSEAINALALVDLRLVGRLPAAGVSRAEPVVDFPGERYVWGDEKGNLQIRRTADDRELFRLPGEGAPPEWILGFSRDGRFLAVRPAIDRLVVWNLARRVPALEVPAQGTEVYPQFTPDSEAVLWSAGDQPLRRCALESGATSTLWKPARPVRRFCCRPNARQIAVAYADTNVVEVLDLPTGKVLAAMPHPQFIQTLQWHCSRPLLATGCRDHSVRVWDPDTGRELHRLAGHQGVPGTLDFHPTLDLLASSAWDGTTRLWSLQTGEQQVIFQEAGDNLQFSADGRRLTLNDYLDTHVLICEVAGGDVCRTLQAPRTNSEPWLECLAFEPQQRWMAAVDSRGVQVFDLGQGRPAWSLAAGGLFSVWFNPEGSRLTASGRAGVLRWPVETQPDGTLNIGAAVPIGHANEPAIHAAESGSWLAWADSNRIHVKREGQDVITLTVSSMVNHLAWSGNGRWLAAAQHGQFQMRLWDTASWKEVLVLPATANVRLTFSPDSACLVVGTPDDFQFVDLERLEVRRRLPRFHTSTAPGYSAFSPDGRLLAVARTQAQVALYDYPALRELAAFEAPGAPAIMFLTFDRSGRRLAMASTLSRAFLWDLEVLRRELARLGLDW
ncbi:MAG TPA: protein kinase [Verrucomicrobiae bacterium]